jgi:hypothetical protein
MPSMRLTVVVPGSLVPAALAAELSASLQAPTLARLLERSAVVSEATSAPGLADATWLAREVQGVPPPAPTAPYAWAALTGTHDEQRQVWHADAIHIAVGRDSLIVQGLGEAAPDASESDQLLAAANECLEAAGVELNRAGTQWFLLADRTWTMRPQPLAAVIGRPLPPARPEDGDALQWSRLLNEIQMSWHAHAVNEAREAQGRPGINALWLHGGGTWSRLPPLRWPRVHTRRAVLQGVAQAAGALVSAPDDVAAGDGLHVWDEALAAACEGDWGHWLRGMQLIDRRLAALPHSATLELVMTGWQRIRIRTARPSDRFRFWRRETLAQALAE